MTVTLGRKLVEVSRFKKQENRIFSKQLHFYVHSTTHFIYVHLVGVLVCFSPPTRQAEQK